MTTANASDFIEPKVTFPIGGMLAWPAPSAALPAGFILADGTTHLITTYPTLFGVIGNQFGGDGVTTFALPDFRGRIACGLDNMGGSSANRVTNPAADVMGGAAGNEFHILTEAEMPPHNHPGSTTGVAYASNVPGADLSHGGTPDTQFNNTVSVASQGGGQAFDVLQPTLFLNWVIRAA